MKLTKRRANLAPKEYAPWNMNVTYATGDIVKSDMYPGWHRRRADQGWDYLDEVN